MIDLSPKGDPAGFVRVLDESTLALPDRPGNRRIDTFRNVLENPRVGLIFLIPGKRETVRIGGRAEIVRDADLLATLEAQGRPPLLALVVHVERVMFHCAKCMIRSRELWSTIGRLMEAVPATGCDNYLAHSGCLDGST